jgi:hypothetical protein
MIVKLMLPRIIKTGATTEEEIDINTLEDRLTEERENTKATYISEIVFYAGHARLNENYQSYLNWGPLLK